MFHPLLWPLTQIAIFFFGGKYYVHLLCEHEAAQRATEPHHTLRLQDPLFDVFPPRDHTASIKNIFNVCWLLWGIDMVRFERYHATLDMGVLFVTMGLFRSLTMRLLPLHAPIHNIKLEDRLLTWLKADHTHDLFYSGHMSNATMLYLLMPPTLLRCILGGLCIPMLGITMIMSRLHYTIDLIMAIIVSYAFWNLYYHTLQIGHLY